MRRIEHHYLATQLARMPAQPWLWLGPSSDWWPTPPPPGRGLRLHREGDGYLGDLRCRLPLPLPGEAVNAIVLQHAPLAGSRELIAECARVLMPGGRLWLTTLNPFSPYRLRWRRHRPDPLLLARCRHLLRESGLQYAPPHYLGPLWGEEGRGHGPALLRASCLLEAEKRVAAAVGPSAVPVGWRGQVVT